MELNFGVVNKWLLFGKSQVLLKLAGYLRGERMKVVVICGKRNLLEAMDGGLTYKRSLERERIPYIVSPDVNDDKKVIKEITRDSLGLSFGAPWIFKPEFIALFKGRLLNSHGTRLPQERGGGGFSWRILRREHCGFSVIHKIEKGIDTGDIVKYREYYFPASCRLPADYMRFSVESDFENAKELAGIIRAKKNIKIVSQNEYLSTYWPRLNTDIHGFINWSWLNTELENFICAFDDPYAGASTFLNGSKVRIKKAFSSVSDGVFHPFQFGIVYRKRRGALFIAAQDGSLVVHEVLDGKGKNIIDKVSAGERFYTPDSRLDLARRSKVSYDAKGLKR